MKFNTDCKLHMGELYPLDDNRAAGKDRAGLWTGEKRSPKRGEWYISGAIPTCYCALNDLTTSYAIARVVTFRLTTSIEVSQP